MGNIAYITTREAVAGVSCNWDSWTGAYLTADEAISAAESEWLHLTKAERNGCICCAWQLDIPEDYEGDVDPEDYEDQSKLLVALANDCWANDEGRTTLLHARWLAKVDVDKPELQQSGRYVAIGRYLDPFGGQPCRCRVEWDSCPEDLDDLERGDVYLPGQTEPLDRGDVTMADVNGWVGEDEDE